MVRSRREDRQAGKWEEQCRTDRQADEAEEEQ